MRPLHFLNLRWRLDYRFVTEVRGRAVGPLEQIGVELQRGAPDDWALYQRELPGLGDVITFFGRRYLEQDGRRGVWQHSLVFPEGQLDRRQALAIFCAVYGEDPSRLVPSLYDLLAPIEHWEGDPLVRQMFVSEVLERPEPAAATLIRQLWRRKLPQGGSAVQHAETLEILLSPPLAPPKNALFALSEVALALEIDLPTTLGKVELGASGAAVGPPERVPSSIALIDLFKRGSTIGEFAEAVVREPEEDRDHELAQMDETEELPAEGGVTASSSMDERSGVRLSKEGPVNDENVQKESIPVERPGPVRDHGATERTESTGFVESNSHPGLSGHPPASHIAVTPRLRSAPPPMRRAPVTKVEPVDWPTKRPSREMWYRLGVLVCAICVGWLVWRPSDDHLEDELSGYAPPPSLLGQADGAQVSMPNEHPRSAEPTLTQKGPQKAINGMGSEGAKAVQQSHCYSDEDGDGFGNEKKFRMVTSDADCRSGVLNSDDCDDGDRHRFPKAPELCDRKDNDCDGYVDEGLRDDNNDGELDCLQPDPGKGIEIELEAKAQIRQYVDVYLRLADPEQRCRAKLTIDGDSSKQADVNLEGGRLHECVIRISGGEWPSDKKECVKGVKLAAVSDTQKGKVTVDAECCLQNSEGPKQGQAKIRAYESCEFNRRSVDAEY